MIWKNLLGGADRVRLKVNEAYIGISTRVLMTFVGTILAMWVAALLPGAIAVGGITLVTYVATLGVSVLYWQPHLGAGGALGEFFWSGDDPVRKTILRIYLWIVVAIFVASSMALVLSVNARAGLYFPAAILTALGLTAIVSLTQVADLDKFLRKLALVVLLLNVGVIVFYAIPATQVGEAAKKVEALDAGNRENAVLKCLAPFSEKALGGRVLSPEDRASMAKCHELGNIPAGERSGNAGKSASGGYLSYGYWEAVAKRWSESWGVPLWVAGAALVGLILLHVLLLKWFGETAKEKLSGSSDPKSAGKKKSSSKGLPLGWILIAIIAGIAAMKHDAIGAWWEEQTFDFGRPRIEAKNFPLYNSLPRGSAGKWVAKFTPMSVHERFAQVEESGKDVPLGAESFVERSMEVVVNFGSSPIELSGGCTETSDASTPKICRGNWRSLDNSGSGRFRLDWASDGGSFTALLYTGDHPEYRTNHTREWEARGPAVARIDFRMK